MHNGASYLEVLLTEIQYSPPSRISRLQVFAWNSGSRVEVTVVCVRVCCVPMNCIEKRHPIEIQLNLAKEGTSDCLCSTLPSYFYCFVFRT